LKDERLERAGRDDVRPSIPIPVRQGLKDVVGKEVDDDDEVEPSSL
jgi:hypothetical protein